MDKKGALGIHRLTRAEMKEIDGGCSVSCNNAYVACCNPGSCICLTLGQAQDRFCESGGVGASDCSS